MSVKSVAVYCGENPNMEEDHIVAASLLGEELAKHGVKIVFGGTKHGLMGVVANGALRTGGEVIGVVTKATPKDRIHPGLTELHIVEDLDERKKLMTKLSGGSLALPGGHGTFDELEREITLVKFGQKNGEDLKRNIVIFDPNNFFHHYQKLVEKMGKVKGDDKDSKLYSLVKDNIHTALFKLGVIDEAQYRKTYYLQSDADGNPKEVFNEEAKPISDLQRRTITLRENWTAVAGTAIMASSFVLPHVLPDPAGSTAAIFTFFGGVMTWAKGMAYGNIARHRPEYQPAREMALS